VRPGAVPRDPEDRRARRFEFGPPVTQEDELVSSGTRPVEQIEEEQHSLPLGRKLAEPHALVRSEPHFHVTWVLSGGDHAVTGGPTCSVTSAISLTTSARSRFAFQTRS
jgi:hypothetical protein